MIKWASDTIGNDDFELVLNGDLVEGIHHRSLQVMSPDVGDQTTAVLEILISARSQGRSNPCCKRHGGAYSK